MHLPLPLFAAFVKPGGGGAASCFLFDNILTTTKPWLQLSTHTDNLQTLLVCLGNHCLLQSQSCAGQIAVFYGNKGRAAETHTLSREKVDSCLQKDKHSLTNHSRQHSSTGHAALQTFMAQYFVREDIPCWVECTECHALPLILFRFCDHSNDDQWPSTNIVCMSFIHDNKTNMKYEMRRMYIYI